MFNLKCQAVAKIHDSLYKIELHIDQNLRQNIVLGSTTKEYFLRKRFDLFILSCIFIRLLHLTFMHQIYYQQINRNVGEILRCYASNIILVQKKMKKCRFRLY